MLKICVQSHRLIGETVGRNAMGAQQRVAVQVNTELLSTYWNVGRIIVEHEQGSKERADYGKEVLK